MKKLLVLGLLLTNVYAYQVGDTISDNIAAHIGCKEDKIYVIDFFASWCGSCKKELPLISKANDEIDKSKIEIIGIDVDKDVNKGVAFQNSLKADNKLNFKIVNDPNNLLIAEFAPIGMPTLYYVKNKKIVGIVTGAVDAINEKILNDIKGIK
jgi:cytochrome c biogenesis protein CcmG, thiol:disulfide interchange protein DsbE